MSDVGARVVGVDTDLDMLCDQVAALHELARSQKKKRDDDRVYAFSIRWGAMMFGRLERLEHYSCEGAMTALEQERYDSLVAELRELLPVMDELGVARPTQFLSG